MRKGSNIKQIRILNRSLVLRQISSNRQISRVDIAARTGLTKTTITNVVQELIEMDYVKELNIDSTEASSAFGRRPVMLGISEKAPLVCGMLLKRERTVVLLASLEGKILDQITDSYKGTITPKGLIEFLLGAYHTLCKRNKCRLFGIGISAPGMIDAGKGLLLNIPNFFDEDCIFPIVDILKEHIDLPIILMHDTNASILAEQIYNYDEVEEDCIFLSCETGIGMGFLLNGEVYNGATGKSGEFGHTSIDITGARCGCGNRGCLEQYASIARMQEQLKLYGSSYPAHPLLKKKDIAFGDFVRFAAKDDTLCSIILREYVNYLAFGLVNVINLLDIDTVIIEYDSLGYCVMEEMLEHSLNQSAIASPYKQVRVRQSRFGSKLSLVGTIAIIAADIFNGTFYDEETVELKQKAIL